MARQWSCFIDFTPHVHSFESVHSRLNIDRVNIFEYLFGLSESTKLFTDLITRLSSLRAIIIRWLRGRKSRVDDLITWFNKSRSDHYFM